MKRKKVSSIIHSVSLKKARAAFAANTKKRDYNNLIRFYRPTGSFKLDHPTIPQIKDLYMAIDILPFMKCECSSLQHYLKRLVIYF